MSCKRVIITKGIYMDKELRLLVSFDENDRAIDIINLDTTLVGTEYMATVEKVLKDIDASILVLDNGQKGFIENKKLHPDEFVERHSLEKKVCQGDKFKIVISQDKKGSKPYSCNFIGNTDSFGRDFLGYYFSEIISDSDSIEIVSDIDSVCNNYSNIRRYHDASILLWNLYDLTKVLDKALSKVVHLKNGGNIVIESTEALTVIDVNSGKNYGKSNPMETNLQAVKAIARQLRLRSISGIIIIDFLKVSKDEEEQIIGNLKKQTNTDIAKVAVHGFTRLGLLEITRSRILAPLTENLE